ncbi:hypothetical protein LEP1GSC132_4452 [Leptospira kirschneri str. 200803703]|nr:hypothetical protein LEP1GSC018_2735 [Leptospira kirschneri str. 2008720114]EKQ82221.1 hypothetical protein LEP1GSC064_4012 [Leptospira kirschneri serovar Grippotyphosa str. Moskva]EKR06969.1 hypothetical protein LEP1GSC122_3539 [Leptospira kirschneri serovar Valbuzzi str. 200702274]EMJ98759.1 hypothetical protein LEP1GSC176_0408 [Leptospira kirschneri str. MMD1493]EMN03908.1 hypothetical protein LEP1GSC046_0386 [Leptospira kirschneri serovar Bim str. 1051]EMO68320.1 hypothetical protein LE
MNVKDSSDSITFAFDRECFNKRIVEILYWSVLKWVIRFAFCS